MNEYIIGLDIGTTKICAAAGRIDKNGLLQIETVSECESHGIKKGMIIDTDSASTDVKSCIDKLQKAISVPVKEIYVSISGECSELIHNKAGVTVSSGNNEIGKNDVLRVIKAAKSVAVSPKNEIVTLIPEQYIVDGYENIKNPVGMCAGNLEMEAHIVIAQTAVINDIYKSINKAGIKIKGLIYLPAAAAKAVLKQDEANAGTAVVDCGTDSIDIIIYKGGSIVTNSVIPVGGNTITNDLAICLNIPFEEAEKIKIEYGDLSAQDADSKIKLHICSNSGSMTEVDRKLVNEILDARVAEILNLIQSSIISSGLYDEILDIVILGGGISLLNGIEDYGKIKLGKPVRIGYAEYEGKPCTRYSGAIGIVQSVYDNLKSEYLNGEIQAVSSYNKFVRDDSNENAEDEKKQGNVSLIAKIKDFFTDFF